MKFARRQFLQLAAGAAVLPAVSNAARAETWPARPIRLIIGYTPGGSADLTARLMGQWLSERLGQPFIVDNRAGAGGNLASEFVVRAPADGYTLLYASTAIAINETLYAGKLSFNAQKDLAPVAAVVRTPVVMEVNNDLPVKNVAEFIAYAKANPGKVNFATIGAGSLQHLCGEYFKMQTGIDMVPVHYRGAAQAIPDLMAGRVQVMFDIVVSSLGYINAGQVRPLAVATPAPHELLPGIPTIGETVPGFGAGGWQGVCAPSKTPPEIVAKLNQEINAVLADPKLKARLVELGGQPTPGTPSDWGKFIADETDKWGKVVRQAGLKID